MRNHAAGQRYPVKYIHNDEIYYFHVLRHLYIGEQQSDRGAQKDRPRHYKRPSSASRVFCPVGPESYYGIGDCIPKYGRHRYDPRHCRLYPGYGGQEEAEKGKEHIVSDAFSYGSYSITYRCAGLQFLTIIHIVHTVFPPVCPYHLVVLSAFSIRISAALA